MADSTAPSNATLARRIRSAPDVATRTDALVQLIEREPRSLVRTLTSVALNPELDPSVRTLAVGVLGRRQTPAAIEALRSATGTDELSVARRAIERLGKVGVPGDLALLRRLRAPDPTTEQIIRSAKEFISYRHGLGEYTVSVPQRALAATTDDAVPIRTGAPTKTMLQALELVPANTPGIRAGARPARRLQCGSRELALLVDEDARRDGMRTLAERQAVPAVVAMLNPETGRYDAAYYLLTDPVGRGRLRIAGVRTSGRVALRGTGVIDGSTVRFEVNATELPIDHPLTVSGTYDLDTDQVRFEVALTEPRFAERQQRRRAQPRAVTQPER